LKKEKGTSIDESLKDDEKQQLAQLTDDIAKLKKAVQDAVTERTKLELEISELQNALDTNYTRRESELNELMQLAEIGDSEPEIDQTKAEMERVEKEINEIKSKQSELETNIEKATDQLKSKMEESEKKKVQIYILYLQF
jgi:chromosome segregation ATPase